MSQNLSIIIAFRDRDLKRVRLCMRSIDLQTSKNFEVVFVDYGSSFETSQSLQKLLLDFPFTNYYYLEVTEQLWNKSKALNYGIKQANGDSILIADIDLIIRDDAISILLRQRIDSSFYLFPMAYLSKHQSLKFPISDSKNLESKKVGTVNGIVLAPREAFFKISGFDEFFHFYGSEDVDLYERLKNAGYSQVNYKGILFYHLWHPSFQATEGNSLTTIPRVQNAMRLNEQHYFINKRKGLVRPPGQISWGAVYSKVEKSDLKKADISVSLENIAAVVEHFFFEEIKCYSGKTIKVKIIESAYYRSVKYQIKKISGRQTQRYLSMKEVNDLILKRIVFCYRNYRYSYLIEKDFKTIIFTIEL